MSGDGMYILLAFLVEATLFFKFLRYFRRQSDVEAVATVGAMIAVSVFPVDALNEAEVSVWIYRLLLIGGVLVMIVAYTLMNFLRNMRGGRSDREKKASASK